MFSASSTAWHYLFAIFNGTNGLILFLIYFYGRAMAFYRIRRGTTSVRGTEETSKVIERKESTVSEHSEHSDNSDDSF
jgi:hypothetical protein